MKTLTTLCLVAATSACVLTSIPAIAQQYGYPERCRVRPHHATYRCDDEGYGGYGPAYGGYPAYPAYAQPYGPPPFVPYGGYAFRGPHHPYYGGYGYGGVEY